MNKHLQDCWRARLRPPLPDGIEYCNTAPFAWYRYLEQKAELNSKMPVHAVLVLKYKLHLVAYLGSHAPRQVPAFSSPYNAT